MRKLVVSATIVCLMLVIGMLMPIQACALSGARPLAPSISITPDEYLAPNEQETVKGSEFTVNATAQIDLIMPSGATMVGVAYASTSATGAFTALFTAPNANGDGYVRASSGAVIVSKLVHFTGVGTGDLSISLPSTVYSGINATITITSTTLIKQNYIVDVTVVDPQNMESTKFFVLHSGVVYVTWKFNMVGNHILKATVETVNISDMKTVNVQKGSGGGGGGGGGGGTSNITWIITRSGTNLMIMLDDGVDFVQTGYITVISPTMNQTKISLINGIATYILSESGSYQFRYTGTDGLTTAKIYSYSPSVSLTATVSSTTGKITISVIVDGQSASGSVEILKVADGTSETQTLSGGQCTYMPDETGSYVVSYTYMNKKYSKSVTWTDTAQIDTFFVDINGNSATLSGVIIGKISQKPMNGVTVMLTASFMQKVTTLTDTNGEFIETVVIGEQGVYFSKTTLAFTAQVGVSKKTATLSVEKNFIGDYWWILMFGIIVIIFVIYKYGFLHKATGGKMGIPSMGRGQKPFGQRPGRSFANPMGRGG